MSGIIPIFATVVYQEVKHHRKLPWLPFATRLIVLLHTDSPEQWALGVVDAQDSTVTFFDPVPSEEHFQSFARALEEIAESLFCPVDPLLKSAESQSDEGTKKTLCLVTLAR